MRELALARPGPAPEPTTNDELLDAFARRVADLVAERAEAERAARSTELRRHVAPATTPERRAMSTHSARLEHLRRALESARAEPSTANLGAVAVALEGVEFGNDDDSSDEDDHIELRCDALARLLVRQLGPSAPTWLRRFTSEKDAGSGDDGPPGNAIVYECPICGAEVESAPGLRLKCAAGHPPAFVVAAVRDDE